MTDASKRFQKALTRKRESKNVEFKGSFQGSTGEWCEIVKDIVAISNTGGGIIVFGLKNNGTPSGEDTQVVAQIDPATITDKVSRYTGIQYSDFQIFEDVKDGQRVFALALEGSPIPMVFEKPGTYPVDKEGKGPHQKTAFSRGTVYFRHGAKSEPGTIEDLRAALERRLESIRDEWLSGVKKVVSAPSGSHVEVKPSEAVHPGRPDTFQIRISDDPLTPVYRVADIDKSHPYRQKEVIAELMRRRPELHFNAHDILCVRRVHDTDNQPIYCHKGGFASSPQYSEAFIAWLEERLDVDGSVFQKCRTEYRQKKTLYDPTKKKSKH